MMEQDVGKYERKTNMDEKLVSILNEMADYLNIAQMKKLQEVLLKNLSDETPQKEEISNNEYLKMFIDAKRIEGCSMRTLSYYQVTVEHLLSQITCPIRKITTDQIRCYLANSPKRTNCSKVTVDNIRRNISSFFFVAGGRRLYIKKPNEAYS